MASLGVEFLGLHLFFLQNFWCCFIDFWPLAIRRRKNLTWTSLYPLKAAHLFCWICRVSIFTKFAWYSLTSFDLNLQVFPQIRKCFKVFIWWLSLHHLFLFSFIRIPNNSILALLTQYLANLILQMDRFFSAKANRMIIIYF